MVRTLKKHPSLFSLALVVLAVPLFMRSYFASASVAAETVDTPAGFAATVTWAGLGPAELTAAGLTGAEAAGVVADVLAEWNAAPSALPDAQAAYVAAKQEKQRLERLVRSGRASSEDVSALQTAKATYDSAEAARQAVLGTLFTAGVADLSDSKVACLETLRANAEQLVPVEYRVADRTESGWLALETALANESISNRYGETPAPECVTHLASVRADADVASAIAACSANLDAVTTAWNAAVDG